MRTANDLVLATFLLALLFVLSFERADPATRSVADVSRASASSDEPIQEAPIIRIAQMKGKKLIVTGDNFDQGATVLINGVAQKTKNKTSNTLVAKKVHKIIGPDQIVTLQVLNFNGMMSEEITFYTGCGS